MIFEYAVFPGLFNSEDRITALYGAFGIESGRLISDFPQKQWAALASKVIDNAASNPDERKRWNAALIALIKRALYRRQGTIWNKDDPTWIRNAIEEHRRRPFRGILYNEVSAEPEVMRFGIDLAHHPNWSCPNSFHRPRNAEQMIQAVASLLDMSTTLVLVDPHFWAADGRWQNVLLRFTKYLSETPIRPHISHIHYITRTEKNMTDNETERQFRSFVEPHLPTGISIGFHLVLPAVLHDRFVLTDRGGVQFGRGLDEGPGDVLITRLGEQAYEKEWDDASRIRSGTNSAVRHRFQLHRSP